MSGIILVQLNLMDPMDSVAYKVVQDIADAGYVRGQVVMVRLEDGPGRRMIGPEVREVITWLGRGWLEEIPE